MKKFVVGLVSSSIFMMLGTLWFLTIATFFREGSAVASDWALSSTFISLSIAVIGSVVASEIKK